jgi:YggT family protein
VGLFGSRLIEFALFVATVLILGRVLLSWVDPRGRTQLGAFVYAATEPFLAPVRRALPPTGMLDLSPLIVLVVLSLLLRLF